MQASPVVPVPANGSNTNPSLGVTNLIKYLINAKGLTVGCLVSPFSFLFAFAL